MASSWEDVERVWSHLFGQLGVHPNEHPVLVCEPHLSPKFHKERLAQLLFEGFSVPALLTQSQAVLALFSTGATHGVVVDAGAVKALRDGRSLLPAGISAVEGDFRRGDAISVRDADGREIARGLSAYNAADARQIAGQRSSEIEEILGYRGRDELIHRDDMVLAD